MFIVQLCDFCYICEKNFCVFWCDNICCNAVTQGWLLHRTQQESDVLLGLFDRIYNDLVVFSVQNLNKKMVTLQCNEIVQVGLRHCIGLHNCLYI